MTTTRQSSTLPIGRRIARLAAAATIAAALGGVSPAAAAPGASWIDGTLSWMSGTWHTIGEVAGAAWSRAATYVLPEAPLDWLPDRMSERDRAFLAAMQAAGYRLATAETGGGLLPTVQYRFVLDREPTPPDIERTRRMLEDHGDRFWGLSAMSQRRILRSLIEASGSSMMRVSAVEIGLRPVPWIRYELAAIERPLEDADRRLLERMADQLNRGGAR